MPIGFNVSFALLGVRFDYPDILRRPTDEVLSDFAQGGTTLVLIWWAFALTAVLFAPLVILFSAAIYDADPTLLTMATTIGVLAATGPVRRPYSLAIPSPVSRPRERPAAAGSARQESIDIVFQSFNRYLGVAVGEHLGYLFTGAWSVLAGVALTQTADAPAW